MRFDHAVTREAASSRTGVVVALAGNLVFSGVVWVLVVRFADIVADYHVWVEATAAAFVVTLVAGVALQRRDDLEELGDGVLRGAAILAVLYVLWNGCASAYFAD
jgi:hypothetical protein